MALVASPLSCHHLYHPHPPIHRTIHKSTASHSLYSILFPKATLSLSAKTLQRNTSSNTCHYQFCLSQEISKLCNSKNLAEALNLLLRDSDNVTLDLAQKEAMGVLLQACGHYKDIEVGRKVHEIVWASNQFRNDFVLNTRIITMYSMCGSPFDSLSVFDQLQRKNLYQWNALVSGYTRNELWYEAMSLFFQLISTTEHKPDSFTLPCVLKACGGLLDLGLGQAVHRIALKMGLVSDVFLGNALIAMYGKCGVVGEMITVFECMPERNLVSWNSMIRGFSENGFLQESFCLFQEMLEREEGLIPDVATLVTMFPVCAGEGDVEVGKMVHGLAVKLRLNRDLMVNNALVDMYSKCGFLFEAQMAFDKSDGKNLVSWNSIIGSHSREGDVDGTFDLLQKMQMDDNLKVNEVTILNVLPVCVEKLELPRLKELHGYSLRHGFQYDELVANAFIAAYAKCGSLTSAEQVFYGIENKTVSSWNALIGGCAQNGNPSKALDVHLDMTYSGLNPDRFSIGSLLLACAHLKFLNLGKEIHAFVLRNGLETDSFIDISLLSLYMHCGKPLSAQVLFDGMEDKSLVSWNAIIAGYSQNGLPDKALSLFRQMVSDRIQPYEIAIMSVLGACSQLAALRLGKEAHCFALKARLSDDIFVGCSMVDMYAKTGSMEESQKVFDQSKEKDVASWTVLIAGYGIHGHGKEANELFQKMQRLGLKPDGFTFVAILMACSHAGLVENGLKYFSDMKTLHGIEPKLEHYACVIDMLGRSGLFGDALDLVSKMPEEPDAGIWSSLLSSCRVHSELDLGKKLAEKLLQMEPNKADNYVLVSNLFAGYGKWDVVQRVRGRMKEIGIRKEVGCTWIEVGGKIYNFVVGDNMRPDLEEIRNMWRRLEKKISKIGYIPNTSSVLHDLKDEEKIEILRGHSEKLAISFGLLKTNKGVNLRVYKNLRICEDCHNAIKLVSKIVDREILIRDKKRFHHFRRGFCSCGDFW